MQVPHPADLQRHEHMLISADKLQSREPSLRRQIATLDDTVIKSRDARKRIDEIRDAVHKRRADEAFHLANQTQNFNAKKAKIIESQQNVNCIITDNQSDVTEYLFQNDGTIATMSPVSALHSTMSSNSESTDSISE